MTIKDLTEGTKVYEFKIVEGSEGLTLRRREGKVIKRPSGFNKIVYEDGHMPTDISYIDSVWRESLVMLDDDMSKAKKIFLRYYQEKLEKLYSKIADKKDRIEMLEDMPC